jgi:hypothetical protein
MLVDEAAEPVASADAGVVAGGWRLDLPVGWLLAEGPVRPVGVVVIDVLAKGAVEGSITPRNALAALPKSAHPGAKKALAEIWGGEGLRQGGGESFEAAYGAMFPEAIAKITDDVGGCSPSTTTRRRSGHAGRMVLHWPPSGSTRGRPGQEAHQPAAIGARIGWRRGRC